MKEDTTIDINQLVADVFGLTEAPDALSPKNCTEWDSLGHIELWLAIQDAVGESIAPAEEEFRQAAYQGSLSVKMIKDILSSYGLNC